MGHGYGGGYGYARGPYEGITGLGRVLGLPNAIEQDTASNAALRTLLTSNASVLGLDPQTIAGLTPEPGMQFLNPSHLEAGGHGTLAKILSGVGDVGQLITTFMGQPQAAPRVNLSAIGEIARLRSGQEAAKSLADYRVGQGQRYEARTKALGERETERKSEFGQRFGETTRHNRRMEDLRQEGIDKPPKPSASERVTWEGLYRKFLTTRQFTGGPVMTPEQASIAATQAYREFQRGQGGEAPAGGGAGVTTTPATHPGVARFTELIRNAADPSLAGVIDDLGAKVEAGQLTPEQAAQLYHQRAGATSTPTTNVPGVTTTPVR